MKYFAICVSENKEHLLHDYYLDEKKKPTKGVLLFKRKGNAQNECDAVNKIRRSMKLPECYSVVSVSDEDIKDNPYGVILDGRQM
jgi:hypothetical protein